MRFTAEFIESLMKEALQEARMALDAGEVPIGAVLADNQSGEIIARAHNEVEKRPDAAAHAELLTIQRACEHQKNWRLSDTVLCVTLEPCTMCLGAIKLARIPTVVFGASDPRLGACGSIYDLSSNPALGSETRIIRGVQENLCKDLLNQFFAKVRKE